ncbi:MAG TPA: hypothetical protein VLA33_12905 [Gemmatimonadota bacterium]|nr:hypothetical protein [Gemmatimonadota bacterium]
MTSSPRRRHLTLLLTLATVAALPLGCGGAATHEATNRPATAEPATDASTEEAAGTLDLSDVEAWSAELETRPGRRSLVPVGYGTLSQDDITVALRTGGLQIKWVPLSEWVLRLTAPDTYGRLNGYKVSRSDEILELTARHGERDWPLVAFVTFFSREVEASYEPNDLQVSNQGRLYRPFAIIPVTPAFGRDRLDQQETQIGLFLFPAEIDLDLPTFVRYRDAESDRWNRIRSSLDTEHSRANSRAGVGRP